MKKLEKLAALANMQPESISAEMIQEANAELAEAGITALELQPIGALNDLQTQATSLNEQIQNLTAANEKLSSDLTTANQRATDLQANLEQYEEAAGGSKHTREQGGDSIVDEKDDANERITNSVMAKFNL